MPNTIAENLQRLVDAKPAIGNAIIAKGGTVGANDGLEDFATDIATIPSGGSSQSRKDVNFYDYDGTIVNSYTAAEFAELTAMPDNPTHDGLTAQGWNWSLSDAKSYVASYGKLEIGQMYITSDSKTRLYVNLEDYKSPTLELYLTGNSEIDIDWGDGSKHSTFTSTNAGYQSEVHSYTTSGDYIIAIEVINGALLINGKTSAFSLLKGNDVTEDGYYRESLFNIEIGQSVTTIGLGAFNGCYSLTSITIPNSVTSIGSSCFSQCYSLTSITIPNSITSIENASFNECYSLTSITIPNSVTSIGSSCFSRCHSLTSITIPNSVTSIGTYAFQYCSSLTLITIPNGVISISDNAFQYCYSLLNIYVASNPIPTGSPWGAPNTHVNVVVTRHNNYQSSCTEVAPGTTLTGTVNATVGDLVVATFIIRGNTYTIDSDWTLLGISEVVGTANQRTAMAYKIATSSSESLTVTQDTAGRMYINLVSITGASVGTFSGFTTQATGSSITLPKPQGLVIWGVSSSYWGGSPTMPWGLSDNNNVQAIELPTTTVPRCLTVLDQSNNASETFTAHPNYTADSALAAASLTITGIDNFWYYDE